MWYFVIISLSGLYFEVKKLKPSVKFYSCFKLPYITTSEPYSVILVNFILLSEDLNVAYIFILKIKIYEKFYTIRQK